LPGIAGNTFDPRKFKTIRPAITRLAHHPARRATPEIMAFSSKNLPRTQIAGGYRFA
jgi:hypothetical protein